MTFAKIFPYGVDAYRVWYEDAPSLTELKFAADAILIDFVHEVEEAIIHNGHGVFDFMLNETHCLCSVWR